MANILYLVHRLPYPPNKGDKVRSFHLLKHLAAGHKIFLGTFVDDREDEQYIEKVREYCSDLHVARLNPRLAKFRSLTGLATGEALTLSYYRDPALRAWVEGVCRTNQIDAAVVFSSAMAQYAERIYRLRCLVDFVDVDSAKWSEYADKHRWPMSWVYKREGKLLLEYERSMAARADRSFFVTENETTLFRTLAPECAVRVEAMPNGVDSDFFSPTTSCESPYGADELPIAFTGAMDYWPNADAVIWFVTEVLPKVRSRWPQVRFYVVGRSPGAEVQALASEHVVVTGTVPDVRPYIQHAAAIVAPLRVARGVQNKILEAMAMEKPVVASATCAGGIDARQGNELLVAERPDDYVRALEMVLQQSEVSAALGQAARARVLERYSWDANMQAIDRYLVPRKVLPA